MLLRMILLGLGTGAVLASLDFVRFSIIPPLAIEKEHSVVVSRTCPRTWPLRHLPVASIANYPVMSRLYESRSHINPQIQNSPWWGGTPLSITTRLVDKGFFDTLAPFLLAGEISMRMRNIVHLLLLRSSAVDWLSRTLALLILSEKR